MQTTTHTKQEAAAHSAAVSVKRQASLYGLPGRWVTVTVLPDCNRGRNARGTCGHKRGWGGSQPKGAKRAKKQNTHVRGAQPRISATRWSNV